MTSEELEAVNKIKNSLTEALKYTSGDQYDGAGFFICNALYKIDELLGSK